MWDKVETFIKRKDHKIIYSPECDMFDYCTDTTAGEIHQEEIVELIEILRYKISLERELKQREVPNFGFKEEKIRAIIRVLKLLDGTEYSITISHLVDVLKWFIEQFYYQDITVDRTHAWWDSSINVIEIKPLSFEGKRLIDGVTDDWEHDVLSYLNNYKTYDELNEKNTNSTKSKRKPLSNALRVKILERDDYKCQMCGATVEDGAKLHIDHIVPVSKGGKDVESNLQVLCSDCNHGKYNKDYLKHDKRKLAELEGK